LSVEEHDLGCIVVDVRTGRGGKPYAKIKRNLTTCVRNPDVGIAYEKRMKK
jgi:hypothetical protein